VERQALAGGKRAKVVCRSMPLLVSCSSCESHSIGTIQKVAYSIGTIQKVVACFRRFKKKEEEEEERKKKIIYVFLNEKKRRKNEKKKKKKENLTKRQSRRQNCTLMSMLRLPSLEPISSKSKKRREGRERKKVHKKEKLIIKIKIQIKTELTVSSCRSIAWLVFTLNDKSEGGIANWENGGKTGRTGRNQKRRRREIQKKKKKREEKHRLFTETATSSLFHFFSPPFSKEGSVGVSGGEVLVL